MMQKSLKFPEEEGIRLTLQGIAQASAALHTTKAAVKRAIVLVALAIFLSICKNVPTKSAVNDAVCRRLLDSLGDCRAPRENGDTSPSLQLSLNVVMRWSGVVQNVGHASRCELCRAHKSRWRLSKGHRTEQELCSENT